MKKESEELMEECLRQYRQIDGFIVSEWKNDVGSLLHKIVSEESIRIEKHIRTEKEQENG